MVIVPILEYFLPDLFARLLLCAFFLILHFCYSQGHFVTAKVI